MDFFFMFNIYYATHSYNKWIKLSQTTVTLYIYFDYLNDLDIMMLLNNKRNKTCQF